MKKPFFLSSLSFVIAAVVGFSVNMFWPIPQEVMMEYTPTSAMNIGMISWIFSILGIIAFIVGVWNKRWE